MTGNRIKNWIPIKFEHATYNFLCILWDKAKLCVSSYPEKRHCEAKDFEILM